jgi:hypothetical protein
MTALAVLVIPASWSSAASAINPNRTRIAPIKTAPEPSTVVSTGTRRGRVEKLRVATKYQPLSVQTAHMKASPARSHADNLVGGDDESIGTPDHRFRYGPMQLDFAASRHSRRLEPLTSRYAR